MSQPPRNDRHARGPVRTSERPTQHDEASIVSHGPDLNRMILGGATSTFGSGLTAVTLAVVAVGVLHVSGFGAGLLSAAGALPNLVFGLYAGALADRVRRPRRILIALELGTALAVLTVAVALRLGWLHLGVLIAVELACGVLACAAQSLFFTHLSGVVGTENLGVARARLQTASYASSAAASATAGALVRALTPTGALLVDVATYLYSAVCLRRISAPDTAPARLPAHPTPTAPVPVPRPGIHHDIADGLRLLATSAIRPVVVYAVVAQTAFAGAGALRAIFLLRTLDLPVALYGLPGLVAALLGTAGSVLAVRMVKNGARPVHVAALFWAAGAVTAFLLPLATGSLLLRLTIATTGIALPLMCGAAANVAAVALLTHHIPPAFMGRINAVFVVTVSFASIAGALLAGWAADMFSVRGALWGCGALGLVGLPLLLPMVRAVRAEVVGTQPEDER